MRLNLKMFLSVQFKNCNSETLINKLLQIIEEQDDVIAELSGMLEAYKEGFDESQRDIKYLNSLLDKYEDQQIDTISASI